MHLKKLDIVSGFLWCSKDFIYGPLPIQLKNLALCPVPVKVKSMIPYSSENVIAGPNLDESKICANHIPVKMNGKHCNSSKGTEEAEQQEI